LHYHIIGDEDTVLGFSLAGVSGTIVRNPEQAHSSFNECLGNKEIAIIIMTERAAEMIREEVDHYVFDVDFPLIVEIPDREGPLPDRPTLREMVNQAIGINL
jgi:V/A-type H+-transporting ATPase subunit F